LSVDPVRRAFGVRRKRKRGAVLPIVEYGKQVSNAAELERKTHELLKRYDVRGEWFRCSVSTAINAILCVAAAAGKCGPSKARGEWIEEQAQAVVIIWRHDRYIPTAMLPRVHQLREEAKEEAEKAGENLNWLTIGRRWSRCLSPGSSAFHQTSNFFGGRHHRRSNSSW
jgi:hypothetical protein